MGGRNNTGYSLSRQVAVDAFVVIDSLAAYSLDPTDLVNTLQLQSHPGCMTTPRYWIIGCPSSCVMHFCTSIRIGCYWPAHPRESSRPVRSTASSLASLGQFGKTAGKKDAGSESFPKFKKLFLSHAYLPKYFTKIQTRPTQ